VSGQESELIWKTERVVAHTLVLSRSFRHWTGRDLIPGASDPVRLSEAVFEAPFVVVSHGMESDPVLNYGNRSALCLWEMSWEELTCTPSRFTAEAPNRAERSRLLAAVNQKGYIEDYSGVRISRTGRRFRITRATVWNLISSTGQGCGQAALFDHWQDL
jgi:hypothetical protein